MSILSIANDILDISLTSDQSKLDTLKKEAALADRFYIVAARKTTPEAWAAQNHAAYVSSKRLYLFMDGSDASDFAFLNGLVVGETSMARELPAPEVKQLISQYLQKDCITSIRLFVKMPLFLDCEPELFSKAEQPESGSSPTPTPAAASLEVPSEVISMAKEILNTNDPAIRATLDPGGCFKNFHSMVDKLLRDSKISPDTTDSAFGYSSGLTAGLCVNLQDSGIPKRIVLQFLELFDLSPYIYQFKAQCGEVASELAVSRIDIHPIKPASVHTTERFVLKGIRRGKDANNAYIYQLHLESPQRKITELVSTPLGYIVGKKYSVTGLDGLPTQDNAPGTGPVAPSDEELAALTDEITQRQHIRSYGDEDKQAAAEEHAQQRQNDIIRYMRQNLGYSAKDAEAKLASIYWEEDLLEEFWQYIKNNKAGKIKVRGYTARQLMRELHFSPYDAYCQMVALRRKPKETEQMLKYRQTDPQYQK